MVEVNLPPNAEAVAGDSPSGGNPTDPPSGDLPVEPSDVTPPKPADPVVVPEATPPKPPQEQDAPATPPAQTPEQKAEISKLYARMKNAEDKAKEYRNEFGELPQNKANPTPVAVDVTDPIEVAKTVAALRDYSPAELDELAIRAKGLGVSPVLAAESDGFKLYVKASREQVASDKGVPSPDGSAISENVKTSEEIGKMSKSEFQKYEKEHLTQSQPKGI